MPLNSTRLELTAVPRPPESDQGNLFVRLTPQTAWNLASLLDYTLSSDNNIGISGELQNDVHFLPLEIVLQQQDIDNTNTNDDDSCIAIYASYNGGAPSTKVIGYNHDIIELPIDIHPSLESVFNSTSEPVIVSVRPLSNVPIAERVTFEPLSIQDWELIEMEANLLEDGGLLNQITIVSPGQVFPLRFAGHLSSLESAAWIKVVDEEFNTTIRSNQQSMDTVSFASISSSDSEFDDSSTEPHEEDNSTNGKTNRCRNSYKYQCVRLMAETEVAVIPKPRIKREELIDNEESNASCKKKEAEPIFCPSKPLRIHPIATDILRYTNLSTDEYSSFPNPSFGFVSVHPSTLVQLPGYRQCNQLKHENGSNDLELPQMYATIRKANTQCSNKNSTNEPDNVVSCIIQASTLVDKGHIGMHQFLRHQLGVIPLEDWISVQIWTESHVTSSISKLRDGTEKIEITKVSSITEKHSTSMHSWNYPDGYSYCSQLSTKSTCKHCSNSIVSTKEVNDTCNLPVQVFSSGCIFSVGYLQELGLDGLDEQDSPDMYILKIKSSTIDSVDKHPCTSEIIPMITGKDLKGLRVPNIQVEGNDNKEVLELHIQSSLLPFSNKQTVGFNKAIETVQQSIRQILSSNYKSTHFASTSMNNIHAIMITGEEGSGKTHLSVTAASQLYVSDLLPTIYLDCKKLQATSTNIQTILEEVQKSFQEAVRKQPSILILDCLDTLIPNVGSSDTEGSLQHQQLNPALAAQVKIIVDHLVIQSQFWSRSYVSENEYSRGTNTGVVLLCTCRDKDSISTRYQASRVFHSLVEVPSLDASQRAQFLYNNVFGSRSSDDRIPHAITRLGKVTDGFRPKDLKVISTRIVHVDYLRNIQHASHVDTDTKSSSLNVVLESGDVASILEDYSPLSQQMVDIDHNSCLLDWESVGGLQKAKQSLHDSIIHPVKFKSVYEQAPISLPTGILLYGPSGNGKSFIVPILAKKSKLNLIKCRGPKLLDRYIGASEAKVRQLFARASAAAPCIIFFDDFDALAPQRGSDNTGVTDRVVNQLLTLLDGAESDKKTHNIFIVAATSRPDKIDKALLRPGRLEKHIYVGHPESLLEWNSLFSSLLIDRNVDEEVIQIQKDGNLFDSFCTQDCAYAQDFSAADMKAVLDTAHLLCVHDILNGAKDGKEEGEEHGPAILNKGHILEAFRRTRPSLLPKDRHILQHNARFGGEGESDKSESRDSLKTALR